MHTQFTLWHVAGRRLRLDLKDSCFELSASRLFAGMKLMQDYLSRCRDPQALNSWLEQRCVKFQSRLCIALMIHGVHEVRIVVVQCVHFDFAFLRAKRLSDYQDAQRLTRPKRRLNEDLTDEEQPRRSPTPPLAHSSSGYVLMSFHGGLVPLKLLQCSCVSGALPSV